MTPKEAKKAFQAIEHKVRAFGGLVSVELAAHTYHSDDTPPLHASIYLPKKGGHGGEIVVDCKADDFEELASRTAKSWDAHAATASLSRIKDMAMSIIRITDETGACTEAALRLAGYGQEEIDALGEEAAAKANAMAANGPFSIERSANANTPEAA